MSIVLSKVLQLSGATGLRNTQATDSLHSTSCSCAPEDCGYTVETKIDTRALVVELARTNREGNGRPRRTAYVLHPLLSLYPAVARRESYDSCLSALPVLRRGLGEEEDIAEPTDVCAERTTMSLDWTGPLNILDGTCILFMLSPLRWRGVCLSSPIPSSRPGIDPIAVCSASGSHRAYS